MGNRFWQLKSRQNLVGAIIDGYYQAINNVFGGRPSGVQLTGPVGVFSLLNQASQLGVANFLNFLGMISIYIAIGKLITIPTSELMLMRCVASCLAGVFIIKYRYIRS